MLLLWWFILPTPSLCWDHYLVQLLPALALSFAWLWEKRSRWGLVAWAVAAWLISRRVAYWDDAYRQGLGMVWCASKLYGMLILGGLLLYLHSSDPAEEMNGGETAPWEEATARAGV